MLITYSADERNVDEMNDSLMGEESDYSSIASSSHDESITSAHMASLTSTLARLQMENAANYSIGQLM